MSEGKQKTEVTEDTEDISTSIEDSVKDIIGDAAEDLVNRHVDEYIPNLMDKIDEGVTDAYIYVSTGAHDILLKKAPKTVFGWIEDLLPEDKDRFVQEAYTSLTTTLSPIHEDIEERNKDVYSLSDINLWDELKRSFSAVYETATDSETIASVFSGLQSEYAQYATGKSALNTALSGIVAAMIDTIGGKPGQKDGVTETSFGMLMENSWNISSNSFLNTFRKNNLSVKVNIMDSTPLDPGAARESLYGSLMLGCPFMYNSNDDPHNRNLSNTILKNARFLSITPGFPKYNSTHYSQGKNNIYNLTPTGEQMLKYLQRNHLDSDFADKDKRYYSFKTDYASYFAYLEAMLNPIWIKLGLSRNVNDTEFNIFSFFNIKSENGTWDPSKAGELIERYNSSIGFYVNPASSVSESVDSSTSDFGIGDDASSRASAFQRINYFTGMGQGSNSARRAMAFGNQYASEIGTFFSQTFVTGGAYASEFSKGLEGIKAAAKKAQGYLKGAPIDILRFNANTDIGTVIQSFAVSNGMKLQYPRLWMDSSYSKSMNFNVSFVSPYGDPLSIFKYVYVPFCALLCFGLPRQASENGLVSPFLVRADIPGLITSDLAMITNITWTKGGSDNLWTKDGLPRAIDVSFTVEDLYPYLAMSKRMSFLSANPSYTVFLDNMSGLCALKSEEKGEDILNNYFDELINRVNAESSKGLWNMSSQYKKESIQSTFNQNRKPLSNNLQKENITWLK